MLIRKPLPRWVHVSLFVAAVAMIPLFGQLRHRIVSLPRSQTELSARLSRCTPPLHVVQQVRDIPESPIWVCVRPQSREHLRGLFLDPGRVREGRWQGIVLCQLEGKGSVITDDFIREAWGEYGMRIGTFVFFGDPDLLQRLREVIIDH